jgi:hypothetical protein
VVPQVYCSGTATTVLHLYCGCTAAVRHHTHL